VTAGTWAYVSCNYLDREAPAGRRHCDSEIRELGTVAQARKIARAAGWLTQVHPDGSKPSRPSLAGFDYCPEHRPDKAPAGTETTDAD
jgi:hypothetical protein